MGRTFEDTHEKYRRIQFQIEFCRWKKLKARILFESQADIDAYESNERVQDLIAQLIKHSKYVNVVASNDQGRALILSI